MPALVNSGARGWCGIRPADPTGVWPRSAKKSRKALRSWLASMTPSSLPAPSAQPAQEAPLAGRLGLPFGRVVTREHPLLQDLVDEVVVAVVLVVSVCVDV